MAVVELATFRAKAGHGDRMSSALPRGLPVIMAADGCLGASVLRCIERPEEFVLRVEWTEVGAHLRFRDAPGFKDYRATFENHLEEVVGFAHYEEL